jgi:hypothetical protein
MDLRPARSKSAGIAALFQAFSDTAGHKVSRQGSVLNESAVTKVVHIRSLPATIFVHEEYSSIIIQNKGAKR